MKSIGRSSKFPNKTLILDIFGLLSILVIQILFTYDRGMHDIHEHLLTYAAQAADGGYRIFLGQMPFKDFHFSMGATLFYLQALFFFILGGFYWKAVALHVTVMGAIATILVFLILRLYLRSASALFFAGITAITFYMPRAYPYSDETAFIFYLMALALFSLAYRHGHKLNAVTILGLSAVSGLAITASVFSKHNIGLAASAFTALLWLFIALRNGDKFTDRAKRFIVFLSSFLLSMLFLIIYFDIHGDFSADMLNTAGQLNRVVRLLPNEALKIWLSCDYGKIIMLVYFSIVGLAAGSSYLLNLPLKEILRDRGLAGSIISLTAVSYISHQTSESGSYNGLALFSLLLGLLYAMLTDLKNSYNNLKVENRRFSNICLITCLLALFIYILWWLTYQDPYFGSRLLRVDKLFLSVMLEIAVFFLALGLIYRKFIRTPFLSSKRIFTGCKIYVLLLAISLVYYYDITNDVKIKDAINQMLFKQRWLVQFNNIPALKDMYAEKKMVKSIEELYSWFKPKLEENPTLKNGSGIYIFPAGQSLYGILGLESFKGVHMVLDYKHVFSNSATWADMSSVSIVSLIGSDPDTDVIVKASPKYIVMYSADKIDLDRMHLPKLKKILTEDYTLPVQIGEFLIYQLHDNKGLNQAGKV